MLDLTDQQQWDRTECGDELTGDKWSGLGCPSCERHAAWRYSS